MYSYDNCLKSNKHINSEYGSVNLFEIIEMVVKMMLLVFSSNWY